MNKKLLMLLVTILAIIVAMTLFGHKSDEVLYYAKVKQISTSGDTRFYWYDTKLKRTINPDNQYSWFWAMPENVPSDPKATDEWVAKIKNNQDSVFKITGVREKEDCGYYDAQHCVQSIKVKSIKIVEN